MAADLMSIQENNGGTSGTRLQILAPIYGWFTEGFGTPDLEDAKALLDELV